MPDPTGKVVDISILTAETRAGLETPARRRGETRASCSTTPRPTTRRRRARRRAAHRHRSRRRRAARRAASVRRPAAGPRRGRRRPLRDRRGRPSSALLACFSIPTPTCAPPPPSCSRRCATSTGAPRTPLIGLLDDRDELVRQSAAYALGALDSSQGGAPAHRAGHAAGRRCPTARPTPRRGPTPTRTTAAPPSTRSGSSATCGPSRPLLFLVEIAGRRRPPLRRGRPRARACSATRAAPGVVRQAFEGAPYRGPASPTCSRPCSAAARSSELLELAESDDADRAPRRLRAAHPAGLAACRPRRGARCSSTPTRSVRAAAREASGVDRRRRHGRGARRRASRTRRPRCAPGRRRCCPSPAPGANRRAGTSRASGPP